MSERMLRTQLPLAAHSASLLLGLEMADMAVERTAADVAKALVFAHSASSMAQASQLSMCLGRRPAAEPEAADAPCQVQTLTCLVQHASAPGARAHARLHTTHAARCKLLSVHGKGHS